MNAGELLKWLQGAIAADDSVADMPVVCYVEEADGPCAIYIGTPMVFKDEVRL